MDAVPRPPIRNVPGFALDRLLGQGGYGQVYLARDLDSGAEVALKVVVFVDDADPVARQRFERELTSLARVAHPCVPALVRGGIVTSQGLGFLATRYVDGPTFGAMRPAAAGRSRIAALLDVLDALEGIHRIGLAHRDVKPSNVIVPAAPEETAMLVDFGIAHVFGDVHTPWTRLTSNGSVTGSADYLAPERIEGELGDGRADLFSVGVMLHHVLYGALPFRARTPSLTMLRALTGELERPSGLDAAGAALNDVVRRALEKRPEARFPSARAFADALVAALPASRVAWCALEHTGDTMPELPTT